jgi:pyruvate/2-oxoglutarate/acetoin dehydrogenase E1 component
MVGLRPIIEFMTFNFSLVAIDQIVNNAAKIFQMSAGQFHIPIVFRGPGGPAVQVASQHSQALESFYAHVPGLKVGDAVDPGRRQGAPQVGVRDDNPVIFIEGETLYNTTGEVPRRRSSSSRSARGRSSGRRARHPGGLVGDGAGLHGGRREARRAGNRGEVVDPRTLRPLDDAVILESVKKTGRCVIVEIGWPMAGFGAEVAYRVQRECLDQLDAPIERVTSDDVPCRTRSTSRSRSSRSRTTSSPRSRRSSTWSERMKRCLGLFSRAPGTPLCRPAVPSGARGSAAQGPRRPPATARRGPHRLGQRAGDDHRRASGRAVLVDGVFCGRSDEFATHLAWCGGRLNDRVTFAGPSSPGNTASPTGTSSKLS